MADKFNICEEIEIAILSDSELTQEQKDHIDNCESCKALLSQVSSMKSDLRDFSVPGIKEGQIADSVMASIKKQKTSVPFPKFKFTHHLGTAAAVAIILVATLVINNPSSRNNSDTLSSNDSAASDQNVQEAQVPAENHFMAANNKPGTSEDPVFDLYYAAPPASGSANASNDTAQTSIEESCQFNDNDYDSSGNIGSELPRILNDTVEKSAKYTEDAAVTKVNIFSDINFGSNLEENIRLANERIFEMTGKNDYFNPSDFSSNEEFLIKIGTFEIN